MERVAAEPLLHTHRISHRAAANRVLGVVYLCGIVAVLYHRVVAALQSTSLAFFSVSVLLLIADVVLAFTWSTTQALRLRPVYRREFPENLEKVAREEDFPAVDVFICTADPYKEPPMRVVNTALSVMAYDYPPEKLSVYVSDDGGSAPTLFAFMEAAKFGRRWLPFCRKNQITERCPEVYFRLQHSPSSETEHLKMMYEEMKKRVESAVERGKVEDEYITSQQEREAFNKWTTDFSPHHHPAVIQVLLEREEDRDVAGQAMPNLIYASRQKSRTSPHNFKGGALNVLLRVSATMTNAPIILTLDCDMYSNDPQTARRALCYFSDPKLMPKLGYIQFPQSFVGLNKDDIYASALKRVFEINPPGMDGFVGPIYVGTGTFFSRRVFFGGPSSFITPEKPELRPDHVVTKPIRAQSVLELAHQVADSNYESNTSWGSKMGFRYGCLVEDFFTGYRLHCEGWKSVFCHPNRPAFSGAVPITLSDSLNQIRRWSLGLLEVGLSKYSPLTFGIRGLGLIMGLCYAHHAFWGIPCIAVTIYAFLPQLTLLNGVSIFPKVSDKWFMVYASLALVAYGQDCLDFVVGRGTLWRWWNEQRMWMIKGVTAYLFALVELASKLLGMGSHGFNVTSKAEEAGEQSKRYEEGRFEFGEHSPMLVPLAMAALINLAALLGGVVQALRGEKMEGLFGQMFIAGFGVVNCWPVYEAMVLRTDKGRMPTKTTIISVVLAWVLYKAASLALST